MSRIISSFQDSDRIEVEFPDKDGKKKRSIKPEQYIKVPMINTYKSEQLQNFGSGYNNSPQTLNAYLLHSSSVNFVTDVQITETVRVNTSASELIPQPLRYEYIQFFPDKTKSTTTTAIQTLYGDILYYLYTLIPLEQREELAIAAGFTKDWTIDTSTALIQPTVSRQTIMPINGLYMYANDGQDMQSMMEDVRIEIHTRPSIIAVNSAGTATTTLMDMRMVYNNKLHTSSSNKMGRELNTRSIDDYECNYLDWINCSNNAQILNASTQALIPMDNMQNKSTACILIAIRASATAVANYGLMQTLDLANGLIDFQEPGGQSVFGGGTPLQANYFKYVVNPSQVPGENTNMNYYLIPFCDNFKEAVRGIMNGYIAIGNEKYNLALTPPAAGTSQVQTFTSTAALTGGYIVFEFEGSFSAPVIFSSTVAQLKTAFEAMDSMRKHPGLAVTFNAQFDAGAAVTVTFNDTNYHALIHIIGSGLISAGPVTQYPVTTISTPNVKGWTNGTYAVSIYAGVWKRYIVEEGYSRSEYL